MATKQLSFCVNQLIINNAQCDLLTFAALGDEDIVKHDITHKEDGVTETLSIKKVNKNCVEDRFVTFYINQGDKYPYSETVINGDLEETKNPRDPNQLEMDDQFFALVDTSTQRIYLSDQRKKYLIRSWLEEKTCKEVTIKSIIAEEEFIDRLSTVNQISFTLVPNLFNSTDDGFLSKNLVQDIYGFGAEKAKLELIYSGSRITENLKDLFKKLINRKSEFESITVIGRNDENLESIFNLQEITNKLIVEVNEFGEGSKLLNPEAVFRALIEKIKSNG